MCVNILFVNTVFARVGCLLLQFRFFCIVYFIFFMLIFCITAAASLERLDYKIFEAGCKPVIFCLVHNLACCWVKIWNCLLGLVSGS